jgi:hypothetical protein
LKAGEFRLSRLGPWIPEIGGKMRPEKLSDLRKPKLRRNRVTCTDFWPFWAPGNRIDVIFGVPAESGMQPNSPAFKNPQPVVFVDIDQARVPFATEGRDAETIATFAGEFTAHGGDPEAIGEVCISAFRHIHVP